MSVQTLQVMAFDVDGIFTDGLLYYGPNGDHLKAFNILDGLGLRLLQKAGIQTAIITGRSSQMVKLRFSELGVDHIIESCEDKGVALTDLACSLSLSPKDFGYMGDDLPDLAVAALVGFFASVPNGIHVVRERAAYVTHQLGGQGAVREVCEYILSCRDIEPLLLYEDGL